MTAATVLPIESVIAGRYELVGVLGEGGMGTVHEAKDGTTGKRVALKRLSPSAKPLLAQLFEREYQTLAGLRHPGIVEVYEYGRDGSAYYTMELLSGGDLSKAAPMAWQDACRCLRDVASILGLLHARRLVHRDLSPRNLWRLPDGSLKLIDFGALGPFGPCSELVGTPPFVPPEALRMQGLDQRADLFSLGALGYWLLSGVHAYPAQNLAELERVWEHAPPSFAQLAKLMERPQLAEIPPELETMLRSLLRLDASDRPGSTADLIDRLHGIADLPRIDDQAAVDGYVHSKAFVGRAQEQQIFHELLASARQGACTALFVEGPGGVGRSRLLEEFAVTARLSGAVPVLARASEGSAPYAFASLLAEGVLRACPEEAQQAAGQHAALLARLSPALSAGFGMDPGKQAPLAGDLRAKLQAALQGWLLDVSRQRPLVLLADDLHAADEESQAMLAVLAHADLRSQHDASSSSAKLALVASTVIDRGEDASAAVQSLRNVGRHIALVPLTSSETSALLRSVFGEAAYLERLAERLYRICEGNPGHCLELIEHLVDSGAARYAEGVWELPRELSSVRLPRSRDEAALRRLARLTPEERTHARLLSVPLHGELREFLCGAAWQLAPNQVSAVLDTLQQKSIIVRFPNGVRFAHEALRDALNRELDPQTSAAVHLRMADAVLRHEPHGQLAALRAAVHLLRAGEVTRGKQLLRAAASHFSENDLEFVGTTAPMFEECVAILRKANADAYSLALPLCILSFAGYYADRRYALRYGDETLALLSGLLRLDLARWLRPYLGARLALIVALIVAGFAVRSRRGHAPSAQELVRGLIGVATTLGGVAAVCLDHAAAKRCEDAIEPLAALGPEHAAGVAHAFCQTLAMRNRECIAQTAHKLRGICEVLGSDRPITAMPEYARQRYFAGALFSLGISEVWRMGEVLAIADRLEGFGGVYVLSADHLRASYHAGLGNVAEAAHYRRRVEVHAVELGSAWQVETWASADALKIALLTHDALAMKHAAQDLARLSSEVPSLTIHADTAKGAYLILRAKYEEAVSVLDRNLPPLSIIGWAQTCGTLARALNGKGDYVRAERVCRDALAAIDPADLDFPLMNLALRIEYARAEAGLGKIAEATRRLDELIDRHAETQGPLIAGSLYEARGQVALQASDYAACERYLTAMEECYRPTEIQSLKQRVEALRRMLARAIEPEVDEGDGISLAVGDTQLVTRVQVLLRRTGATLAERSARALQIALELTGAHAGFLVLQDNEQVAAQVGPPPNDELTVWASRRLRLARENDETAAVTEVNTLVDLNLKASGDLRYCLATLWTTQNGADAVVGGLVLGFRDRSPRLPSAEVLRAIAAHLAHAVSEESSVSSWLKT